MSHTARNWAKAQVVGNGVAKAVLLELADCANEAGECWPGLPAICRVIEHCDEAVRVAVKLLIKLGLVEKEERKTPGGKMLSPLWRLRMDAAASNGGPKRANGHDASPPDFGGAKPAPQDLPAPQISGGLAPKISQGSAPQISGGVAPQISGGNPSLDTKRKKPKSPPTHTAADPAPPRVRVREEEEEAAQSGKVVRLPPRPRVVWDGGNPPGWERFKAAWPAFDGSWRTAVLDYRQALAEGVEPEVLAAAAERYPFRRGWGTRFIVHPSTWLRERRWETELPAPEPEELSLAELQALALAEARSRAEP
jgi:hypothetical protein